MSVCIRRFHWTATARNAASSFAANTGRRRRIRQRLDDARLLSMHSHQVIFLLLTYRTDFPVSLPIIILVFLDPIYLITTHTKTSTPWKMLSIWINCPAVQLHRNGYLCVEDAIRWSFWHAKQALWIRKKLLKARCNWPTGSEWQNENACWNRFLVCFIQYFPFSLTIISIIYFYRM